MNAIVGLVDGGSLALKMSFAWIAFGGFPMSRGFGAIQRVVLDALSDKLIITLSTIDLAHVRRP
jgi:hypothetical protein